MRKLLLALGIVTLMTFLMISAQAETSGNYEYIITIYSTETSSETAVEITKYNGTGTSLTLPSTLGGYPVRYVGNEAFRGNTTLQSVTIPSSVRSIGTMAFASCSALRTVSISQGIIRICTYAFWGCPKLSTINIPASVTDMPGMYTSMFPGNPFADCSSLKSISVSSSNNTFYSQNGILYGTSIYGNKYCISVPAGKTGSITLPSDVNNICFEAFRGCTGITSVYISNSVTTIDSRTFYNCSGLTEIYLPNSITNIGSSAFYGCSSLTSFIIPDGVTYIGDSAFYNCSGLNSITIPDSVTSIGSYAFYNCSGLNSIIIPDSVTSIGNSAFYSCSGLTSIIISESLTSIDQQTFCGCSGLTSIIIPDSVTSIGVSSFNGCESLTSIIIPDGVTSIGNSAFRNCIRLTSVSIPDSVTSIGSYTFSGCSGLTSIIIPDDVTSINDYTFYDCNVLTSVTIPDSLTSIGDRAFERCRRLNSITIPDSVTNIGVHAFDSCYNLTEIHIPHCNSSGYQAAVTYGLDDRLVIAEHTWEEPIYTWSEDYTTLTALHVCGICEDVEESETVSASMEELLTPSTCKVQGEGVYTSAEFENEAFSAQTINAPLPLAEHTPFISEGFPATCTEKGLTDEIFCDKCGEILEAHETISALGHDWQRIGSTWAEDGSSCLMTLTCARCGESTEAEADVSAEAEKNTSCTEWARTTFTANLTYDEMTFTDTMQLQNVEPIPHTPEIISPVAPTCTEPGLTESQRCSVCGEILEAPETIPALGHEWQLSSAAWAEDGSAACTFILLCGHCGETQTQEADVTTDSKINTSCTEWEWTTYTASMTIDGQTLTDTKQIQDVGPAPHQVVVVPAIAPTDREPGYTEKQYCSLCGLVLVQPEEIPALWSYSDDGLTVTAYNGTETDLTIPEGVTALSTNLFQNNITITSLRIPEGVTTIGALTCFQATNLREVWLPDSLTNISSRTFHNVHAVFHANAGSPSSKALSYLKFNFTDSNGWTLIYSIKSATAAPTAVSIVNIPDTGETSLTVPADIVGVPVTELQSLAVANHAALTEVHLPDNLVTIAADSFDGCPEGLTIYSSTAAPARTWAQENGFAWAHEAHQPEILSAVTPTCTEDGLTEGSWCPECGEILTVQEVIPALGHDWSTVTYTWAEDNSTVTASRICSHNAEHVETETVPAAGTVTKQPTCEEAGETTWTSEAFENSAFALQSKVVADIDPLGHDWNDITYTWAEDNRSVTAFRFCNNDPEHVETETAIVTQLIVSPTETAEGSCEWIGSHFENDAFVQQTKSVMIPALNKLSVLRIPAGVLTIEEEAFEGLPTQAVIIPDGCTAIGNKAFAGCSNLLYVRIPASVTSIAPDAFDGCPLAVINFIK